MPLVGSADEDGHFDFVQKLARGYWPDNSTQTLDPSTVDLMAWYASPEARQRPTHYGGGVYPPPVWSLPESDLRNAIVLDKVNQGRQCPSHEAHSPPLYYGLAAAWYKLGTVAGLSARALHIGCDF